MAAVPFKVSMVVKTKGGASNMIALTASDVNAEFLLFPSGSSEVSLGNQDVFITDMILSAAGTDTSQIEVFLNGLSTNTKLLNATSLATTVGRPFQQAPLKIPAGNMVKFKQLT